MKKLFSVLAVLFVLGTVNVFALGIGPQGGTTPGGAAGAGGLTLKIDGVPCVFGVTAEFGTGFTSVGVTADWWIANPKIERTWGYYYGVGLAGSINVGDAGGDMFAGGRILVGTNVFLLNNFIELYLQAAWEPGIIIYSNSNANNSGFKFNPNRVPVNVGLRFWF